MKVTKEIGAFAAIIFLLLGVLFGAQIMTFIFAQLSPSQTNVIPDLSASVANETGAFVNTTGYTLGQASVTGFNDVVITEVWGNATGGPEGDGTPFLIPAANYTVSAAGVLTNATVVPDAGAYNDANVSYSYDYYSDVRIASDDTTNNSLQAIVQYTSQSDTQFLTVSIAITLAILIAVFVLFWTYFMGKKKSKSEAGGNFG